MDRRSNASRPTAICLPGVGAGAVRVFRRASSEAATPPSAPALRAVAHPSIRTRIPLVQAASRPPVTRRPRQHVRKVASVIIGGLGFLSLGGIAVAAGMGVTSNSLGAGSATIAACQLTGSITSTYVPPTATGSDVVDTGMGYALNSVTLTGIHANCANKTVYVTVVDSTAPTKVLGSGSVGIGPIASLAFGTVQVVLTPATGTTFVPVGGTGASTAGVNQIDVLIPN